VIFVISGGIGTPGSSNQPQSRGLCRSARSDSHIRALAFQRTRKTRRHRVRRGMTGTERRCDWHEIHQGGAGLHGLTTGGNWIRTLGSARDRPRLRGSVVHLSAQKSWRSAEGTHSARGTSTGTDVGRASQEGGLRFGLRRDRQCTRPHHSAGRPRDGGLGDRVRRR
jgi:hypothetical protein